LKYAYYEAEKTTVCDIELNLALKRCIFLFSSRSMLLKADVWTVMLFFYCQQPNHPFYGHYTGQPVLAGTSG